MRSAGETFNSGGDGGGGRAGRRRRRRLWLGLGLPLAVLLAVAAGVELVVLRGRLAVPAGRLERSLSEAVGGKVRIGGLRLEEGPRRAVLTDLLVTDLTSAPQLRRFEVARITLYGSARDLLAGEFDRATVSGARGTLEPQCGPPPALPAGAADRASGRRFEVLLEPTVLRLSGPGPERTLALEGTFRNDGGGLRGDLVLTAEEVELRSLAALWRGELLLVCPSLAKAQGHSESAAPVSSVDATLLDARADVRFEPAESPDRFHATIAAAARAMRLPAWGENRDAEVADVAGSFDVVIGPVARGEGSVVLPEAEPIEVAWSSSTGRLLDARLVAREVDLGRWAELLGPPAWRALEGAADLDVAFVENTWSASIGARLPRLGLRGAPALRAVDIDAEITEVDLEAGTARARGEVVAVGVVADPSAEGRSTSGDLLAALLEATGPVRARFDGNVRDLLLPTGGDAFSAAVDGTIAVTSRSLGALDFEGALSLGDRSAAGRYVWTHADAAALWTLLGDALAAGLVEEGDRLERELAAWGANGSLRSAGSVAVGPAPDFEVRSTGKMVLVSGTLSREAYALSWRPPEVAIDYTLAGGKLSLAARGEGEMTMEPLAPRPVVLEARATASRGALRLESVALQSPSLGTIELDGEVALGGVAEGGVRLRGGEVAAWREWLAPLAGTAVLPASELRGELGADARWRLESGDWLAEGEAWVENGGWAASDGSRVVADLSPHWRVTGSRSATATSLQVSGEIGGFQLLWGPLFADFDDRAVTVQATVEATAGVVSPARPERVARRGDALPLGPLRATLRVEGDGGSLLAASASRSDAESWTWQAEVQVADLSTAAERYVSFPFALEATAWDGLALAGRLDVELAGELHSGGGAASGELLLVGGAGKLGDRFAIDGIFGQLPVQLAWRLSEGGEGRATFEPLGEPRMGRLAFRSLRAAGVEIGPTAAPLEVAGDAIALQGPLLVPLFGGEVVVRGLRLEDGLSSDRHLEAAVELRAILLEQATAALGLLELRGSVDGEFPSVLLRGDVLTTEGASDVAVFGGRVVLDRVSASALRSPFPHLSFAAILQDLDLEQLTQTLEFGRVTGVLAGELSEVELIGSTPVRLVGELRTVERQGVPQRLSVKAVNNLTLLGTGADASFLERGLRSFFESYPYQAIGIAVLLEGDDFVLRGLETRGDKELFLKGRWPLRLDIVNAKPGTRVSYEVMTSRIGNLQIRRGKADAAREGSPP
ncbi:MAG TPA: hypothetical protein VNB06_21815 [Thermoanaerobaculia bacterium]|nr:hypothetical protein [Thermoanaerobaculia bacterium]